MGLSTGFWYLLIVNVICNCIFCNKGFIVMNWSLQDLELNLDGFLEDVKNSGIKDQWLLDTIIEDKKKCYAVSLYCFDSKSFTPLKLVWRELLLFSCFHWTKSLHKILYLWPSWTTKTFLTDPSKWRTFVVEYKIVFKLNEIGC